MLTLEALRTKISNIEDLRSVVRTMKALAMVNMRQYEKARLSLVNYNHTVELGLQALLRHRRFSETPTPLGFVSSSANQRQNQGWVGVILFGSDHGLCGQFNEQIVTYALAQLHHHHIHPDRRRIAAVGARLTPYLEAAKQPIQQHCSLPTSLAGTTQLVQELLVTIEQWRFHQPNSLDPENLDEVSSTAYSSVQQVFLFFNQARSSTSYEPVALQLLPLDFNWLHQLEQRPWNSGVLPTWSMSWESLFSVFVRQYLFASLYQATVDSLTSENASRFASMQAAEKNIQERLAELHARYRSSRQNSITAELLDIVSGFEALKKPDG